MTTITYPTNYDHHTVDALISSYREARNDYRDVCAGNVPAKFATGGATFDRARYMLVKAIICLAAHDMIPAAIDAQDNYDGPKCTFVPTKNDLATYWHDHTNFAI